jgi:hypothetical protein
MSCLLSFTTNFEPTQADINLINFSKEELHNNLYQAVLLYKDMFNLGQEEYLMEYYYSVDARSSGIK